IYEMGGPVEYVYFPFNSMISLVTVMENGSTVEVGLVGSDGMSGITALMGEETSLERAIVQIPDGAMRTRLSVIKEEFRRGGELQNLLLRYTRAYLKQVAQTAACNATHTVEERLARWLLMCHERIGSDELKLTQEFISEMLGTRRATVSLAASALQTEGLIHYHRGHIKIIDRQALEAFSCECFRTVKEVVDGLMG
ncbi:MAG: Crp/Fnr family transcriptional regulator, partial [Pyrinomonadaceae bacterium]